MPCTIRTVVATLALALAATAAPARATIAPNARTVVEHYVAAAGGRAAFDSVRTVRTVARIQALGMAGTTVTYAARPDRRASVTNLGPFRIPEGIDGQQGWRADPGGKILVLDGKDLIDARASAWFENQMWTTAGEGGGQVRVSGADKDANGTYTILEVTPPVGDPRRYWFDDRTHLVVRESMRHDQNEVTGEMSDWRDAGGRKFPFHAVERISGMPANDLTIDIDSVIVNGPVDPAVFRRPDADSDTTSGAIRWLATPGHARIPCAYRARHVWVRASVNGAPPADFLFDTGASITILDSTYAARIGIATQGTAQGQGAGSMGSATFAEIDSLRLAGADDGIVIKRQKIGVLSLNKDLEPFFWRPVAGVVGADFITRVVTTVDYDAQTLTFDDPATFTYAGAGKAVPFTLAANMPAVEMTLDGTWTGSFRVDVGSSGTVDLHGPFVEKNGLAQHVKGKRIEVTGGGFGGTFTSTLTRMKSVALGPYTWADPMLTFSGARTGALASEYYAGNIGNHVLERFRCTFDYERRQLWLEPSKRFGERDRFSRSGVQLARTEGRVIAMQVIPGSPAYKAGLREGDEVATIDGRAAGEWSPASLQDLFEGAAPGRVVAVEVAQGAKKKKLSMKLEDLL